MSTKYPLLTLSYKCSLTEELKFKNLLASLKNNDIHSEIEALKKELIDPNTDRERKEHLISSLFSISSFLEDIIRHFNDKEYLNKIDIDLLAYGLINKKEDFNGLFYFLKLFRHFSKKEVLYLLKRYLNESDINNIDSLSLFYMEYDNFFFKDLFPLLNDRAKLILFYTPIYHFINRSKISAIPSKFTNNIDKALFNLFKTFSSKELRNEIFEISELAENKKQKHICQDLNIKDKEANYLISNLINIFYNIQFEHLDYLNFICSKISNKLPKQQFFIKSSHFVRKEKRKLIHTLLLNHFNSEEYCKISNKEISFNTLADFNSSLQQDILKLTNNKETLKEEDIEFVIGLIEQLGYKNIKSLSKLPEDVENIYILNKRF